MGVWRQLCECVFEAAAHLPPPDTSCCCRLYLLQISGMSFILTYLHRLCLFRVLLDACPFCFLQYTALPACCNCSPFSFRVLMGRCPSPTIWWRVPHLHHCWTPSPLQAHWGRCCHSCLPWPACLFTVRMRDYPYPILRAQGTPPSLLCVFFFICLFIIQFFFFFP
jgi:hypothetical protein